MTVEIVFEDPPPHGAGSEPVIVQELAPLRANPGKWARVRGPVSKRSAHQFVTNLRGGKFAGIDQGEYEAVSRTLDDRHFVWARYIDGNNRKGGK